MKQESSQLIDWSVLRSALMVLAVSLILGASLLIGSQGYYASFTHWEMEQRNILGQLEAEYAKIQETLEITDTFYYQTFNEFKNKGFFQAHLETSLQEQRLKMLTNIKEIIPRLKLPALANYELVAQTSYKVPFQIEPQLKVYETKLILTLGLLHEEDVLQLIETVGGQQFTGLFNLQKCEIKRLQNLIDVKEVSKPNLNAMCILAWYTSTLEKEEPKQVGRERQSNKR